MILKIRIKTPKGHARVTASRFGIKRMLLFRTGSKIINTYINPENDEFIWELNVPAAKYNTVIRNVALFSTGTYQVLKSVSSHKWIKKRMEPGHEEELDAMPKDTKVELVKAATAEEMVEEGLTFWQRVKLKWIKL